MRLLEARRGQSQVVEEHARELHGAVDVELAARLLEDPAPGGLDVGPQLGGLLGEDRRVDVHALALHAREHTHERHLDLVHAASRPVLLERVGKHRPREARRLSGDGRGWHVVGGLGELA